MLGISVVISKKFDPFFFFFFRSKKAGHGSSRSASMDRSGMNTSFQPPPSGAMPSQPFIQDPSMPVNQPPSTTVQLEEAKRRLEESRTAPPVKSKSVHKCLLLSSLFPVFYFIVKRVIDQISL